MNQLRVSEHSLENILKLGLLSLINGKFLLIFIETGIETCLAVVGVLQNDCKFLSYSRTKYFARLTIDDIPPKIKVRLYA